jgi:hypothetical protein
MGRILAWDQLRASGRSGSASADDLIAFAKKEDRAAEMLDAATAMAATTRHQWQIFADALAKTAKSRPGS